MHMKVHKSSLDFSVSGLAAAYIACVGGSGESVDPTLVAAGVLIGSFIRGLWLAYSNDNKITLGEVVEVLADLENKPSDNPDTKVVDIPIKRK